MKLSGLGGSLCWRYLLCFSTYNGRICNYQLFQAALLRLSCLCYALYSPHVLLLRPLQLTSRIERIVWQVIEASILRPHISFLVCLMEGDLFYSCFE